jgi:hypothetical protein
LGLLLVLVLGLLVGLSGGLGLEELELLELLRSELLRLWFQRLGLGPVLGSKMGRGRWLGLRLLSVGLEAGCAHLLVDVLLSDEGGLVLRLLLDVLVGLLRLLRGHLLSVGLRLGLTRSGEHVWGGGRENGSSRGVVWIVGDRVWVQRGIWVGGSGSPVVRREGDLEDSVKTNDVSR